MALTYVKRYRMEIDLAEFSFAPPRLPANYELLPWHYAWLEGHVEAKFNSFRDEADSLIFPALATRDGCSRLMNDIVSRGMFVPEATWLIRYDSPEVQREDYCGTVQGLCEKAGCGSIQNLGIAPEHRSRGLGTCLLYQSLCGFRQAGVRWVNLEVTADNFGAVRLYYRFGFRRVKTVYKAVYETIF